MADGSHTTWLPPGATAPEPAPRLPDPAPEPQRGWRRLFGPLIVAFGLLFKYGKFALLFVGKAKILTTSGSMLVSVAAYSLIWGWPFAVGFVLLLLVHEMGHVIQLRREGIEASAPMFIPFLGAVVAAKSLGDDAAAEARVGLAGPVLGTLGAIAAVPRRRVDWTRDFWRALAFTGFFLNLFNLSRSRRSTAAARWRRWRRGCGSSGCRLAVGFAFVVPEPDHHPHRAARRCRTRGAAGRRCKAGGEEQRPTTASRPRTAAAGRGRLPRAHRGAACSGWTRRTSSGPSSDV